MANLILPRSVGGEVDIEQPAAPIVPIESRASALVLPESVGGVAAPEPIQQQQIEPTQPAQPLSELAPAAIESFKESVAPLSEARQDITEQATGIADIFTGSERIAATPELGEVSEFAFTPESLENTALQLGMLSTFNEKAQLDIIKEAIPEAKFDKTPDGSTFIEVPDGKGGTTRSVLNRPGFSPQDLITANAQILAFIKPSKLASFGKSLAKKAGISFGANVATEQALQEFGVEMGRTERDPVGTLIAGGAGVASEVIKPVFQGARAILRARKAGVEKEALGAVAGTVATAEEAIKGLAEATGGKTAGLFPAQKTLTPVELLKQRLLPQLSASTRIATQALEDQNRQVFNATTELIATIAPDQAVATGAGRFRDAAARAIEVRKLARTEAASPIYKQAFRRQRQGKTPLIDTDSIIKKITGITKGSDASGQIAGNMNTIKSKIQGAGGDLQKLQSVKIEIDNLIEGQGSKTLGRATKRALVNVQTDLVDAMIAQSPSYKAARLEFIRLTPAVEELDKSLIGKIVKIPDDQLKNIAGRIFDPRETNPLVLRNAKKVIDDVDPGAWDEILRVELERRMGGLSSFVADNVDDVASNIPGKINTALFGNPKNRDVFLSALSNDQRKNFGYLETVIRRAMRGRAAGSPTTPFKEALDKMRGVGGIIRDTIFRPVSTLQDVGAQSLFDRRVAKLADAMFNPQWKPQMKKLRALNPNSPAAARAMTQLLDDIGQEEQE